MTFLTSEKKTEKLTTFAMNRSVLVRKDHLLKSVHVRHRFHLFSTKKRKKDLRLEKWTKKIEAVNNPNQNPETPNPKLILRKP